MISAFLDRIRDGEVLVVDGATGTNLQARGLLPGKPAEIWVKDDPEKIVSLHQDFINSGSQIILTCTFNGSRIRLESFGLGDQIQIINSRAVELARKAINNTQVYVAGSIGPLGHLLKPYGDLDENDAAAAYSEQGRILVEAGIDILVIETQYDLNEATIAINSIRDFCPVPIVCSFSYDKGTRTMMGVKPSQVGKELSNLGVDIIGINCGRSLEDNLKALIELRSTTILPIWFKPNAGLPIIDKNGCSTFSVTPEIMGEKVNDWITEGAQIVGGCCGTSPLHLKQISEAVNQRKNH